MRIAESNSEIAEMILAAFMKQIEDILESKFQIIETRIRAENVRLWQNTETYDSLLNGDLNHEFGFKKGTAKKKVDTILEEISKSLIVRPRKFRKKSTEKIGLDIRVLNKNIKSRIFDLEEAQNETDKDMTSAFSNDFAAFSGGAGISGDTNPTKTLPWLHWLLVRGNRFIIFNYRYEDVTSPRSRSGKGLMIPDEGENWRVPPEFSGTKNSHWLIRALQQERKYLISEYGRIINEVLES